MSKLVKLRAERGVVVKRMAEIAELDAPSAADNTEYETLKTKNAEFKAQIARLEDIQVEMANKAAPVGATKPAAVETDDYVKDKSMVVGGIVRMFASTRGALEQSFDLATRMYGEAHPVAEAMGAIKTRALAVGVGTAGGFIVPPDFSSAIIGLLSPRTVVRRAGARTIPMPNGTMTVPKLTGGSSASWVGEAKAPGESGPTFGQVVATARKLMALVPVSNDMMRYAVAGFDAKVRDDLVLQLALAEDAAFLRSKGTQFTPKGLAAFVLAGQTIASNPTPTNVTVGNELIGLQTKLELANVAMVKPVWIMSPRSKNYLLGLQNANGFYIYRDEMTKGALLGWPFFTTTQMPINMTVNANSDCSEIFAVDINEAVIYESRQLELAIATEASYLDAAGNTQNAFAQDLSIVRAITAEDFQVDHDEAIAYLNGVRWTPALA